MDYLAFSKQFFSATGIPVTLYSGGHIAYSSLDEMLGIEPQDSWTIYEPDRNPEFAYINPDLEYGHVRIEGTGHDLFLGPVFTAPPTEELIQAYFRDSMTPAEYRDDVRGLLLSVPINSHPGFIRYLTLLHLVLNHKHADIEEFYAENSEHSAARESSHLESAVDAKENERKQSTYDFEQQLYHFIAAGDPKKLREFLEKTALPQAGQMARTPLRQAKNTFICGATKAGVLGAIPGGVDVERTYQLVNLYILECEQMQSIEDIHRLEYIMMMDFCQRAGEAQIPDGISAEIYRCMTYIRNNTNELIGIDDVAAEINRSSSYLMRKFKKELGMSVGDYITKCKMEEACEMLAYGKLSLAEISAYLGYSSQSYFQNVFKKNTALRRCSTERTGKYKSPPHREDYLPGATGGNIIPKGGLSEQTARMELLTGV